METIQAVFWNPTERRLRTAWRLLAQLMFIVLGLVCFGVLTAIIGVIQSTAGGLTEESFPSPGSVALTMERPALMMLSSLGTLGMILLSVVVAGRFVDRRPFADFGFHLEATWWRDLGFGLGLGALLMALIFLVEWTLGWVEVVGTLHVSRAGFSFAGAILFQVVTYLSVGFYEELFSRGYQLQNLAEGFRGAFGPRGAIAAAWLLSSTFFGILHAANPNASLMSTVNLVIAGLFLGLGYVLTGELAIPIGLHITWNFFQGNVFGFPVSGGPSAVSFIAVKQGGPALWTGGAFGPEAGLLGLAAMTVGSLLTMLWVRRQRGRVVLQRELATYRPLPQLKAQEAESPEATDG
ncbi:MAG: CPBP family intramembrane glutamic endopeptidase [Anaerolineae bacterium]